MRPYFTENFGNASSLDHPYGYDASVAVQSARETIAKAIGASMDEIIFTSGATESDNLALIGLMEKNKEKGSLPGLTAPNTSEISSMAKNTATAPTPDVTVHALRENGETTWHGPGWNTMPS